MTEALGAMGAVFWQKACDLAREEPENERAEVKVRRLAGLEGGAELGAAADELSARVRELEARVDTMRTTHLEEVARLKQQLAEARKARPARAPSGPTNKNAARTALARKFWDSVMHEGADIIRRGEPEMEAETIMLRLDPKTRAGAVRFQALTPGLLAKKMAERARRGHFFESCRSGVFRLAGPESGGKPG